MVFKDRAQAGEKLAQVLLKDEEIVKEEKNLVVLSLLRGGAIVGERLAKNLKTSHYPLVVKKISAPAQKELAIGAICFNSQFLETRIINSLNLSQKEIVRQTELAKIELNSYIKRFFIKEKDFEKRTKNKTIILTDDGVATGATIKAALIYLKTKKPKKIFLAVPVAPEDFEICGFNKVFILHQSPYFSAVSQFYLSFPQIDEGQIKKTFSIINGGKNGEWRSG